MLEQDLNPAATKFIASLVKSLQILCNGQVDFNESIELIGHINVRVDHIHKINYIVDEHVSKEGGDSSTTFLSNSYHSFPPTKSLQATPIPVSQPDHQPIQHHHPHHNVRQDIPAPPRGAHTHTVRVSHKVPNTESSQKQDNIMVKMEGNDNDCMVLPASPEDYEQVEDIGPQDGGSLPGTSSAPSESFEMDYDMHHSRVPTQTTKKRKAEDQNPEDSGVESKMIGGDWGAWNDVNRVKTEHSSGAVPSAYHGCKHCNTIFNTILEYDNHAHYCEHPSLTYQCPICFWSVETEQQITLHMKSHQQLKYTCDLCQSHFKTYSGLRGHKQVKHKEGNTLSCPLCGKVMYSKMNLEGHMNQHNGVKPHICNFCDKSFSYKQSLKAHEKLCTGRLSFTNEAD